MDRKLLLLGILRGQDMHGYRLNEAIDRDLSFCTDLKRATAYFLLNKMAEDGWISQELEQEGNRPPRHVYHLTAEGEAAFQRLLRENLAAFSPSFFLGDIGIAFLDAVTPQTALALLAQRRSELAKALDQAREVPYHPGSLQLVIEHQARHLTVELEWLDEVMERLRMKAI